MLDLLVQRAFALRLVEVRLALPHLLAPPLVVALHALVHFLCRGTLVRETNKVEYAW